MRKQVQFRQVEYINLGDVLDILVQTRRDKKAAQKFFRKLLKRLRYIPRVLITDKLNSGATRAELKFVRRHFGNVDLNAGGKTCSVDCCRWSEPTPYD